MEAIEKIILQLKEQAEEERLSYEKAEKERIESDYQASLIEIEAEHKQRLEKSIHLLEKNYKQMQNRQQVETKQQILNQKQLFLELLFEDAVTAMENWTTEEHRDFAKKALQGLRDLNGELVFICGSKTKAVFTSEWVAEQNKQLDYRLLFSEETIENQAGFLLNDNGVQYNFLYQTLVQDIQSDLGYELAQEFFA
ncbi:V-type sodium ATP synthase subunit E [Enterococcus florum]|uniref:V-type sodium ATP synthase subunit E n=1 Tax=Enterococcus florum TaxID=2480627 RepID=A0A4P5P3B5_9ENTE|nr:hypothetical protein [Enterococcus florum]GCF92225.1 V-type sodium ATP synthase subunit E [Enterococcus florum]